jgi:hypothetical protein
VAGYPPHIHSCCIDSLQDVICWILIGMRARCHRMGPPVFAGFAIKRSRGQDVLDVAAFLWLTRCDLRCRSSQPSADLQVSLAYRHCCCLRPRAASAEASGSNDLLKLFGKSRLDSASPGGAAVATPSIGNGEHRKVTAQTEPLGRPPALLTPSFFKQPPSGETDAHRSVLVCTALGAVQHEVLWSQDCNGVPASTPVPWPFRG